MKNLIKASAVCLAVASIVACGSRHSKKPASRPKVTVQSVDACQSTQALLKSTFTVDLGASKANNELAESIQAIQLSFGPSATHGNQEMTILKFKRADKEYLAETVISSSERTQTGFVSEGKAVALNDVNATIIPAENSKIVVLLNVGELSSAGYVFSKVARTADDKSDVWSAVDHTCDAISTDIVTAQEMGSQSFPLTPVSPATQAQLKKDDAETQQHVPAAAETTAGYNAQGYLDSH